MGQEYLNELSSGPAGSTPLKKHSSVSSTEAASALLQSDPHSSIICTLQKNECKLQTWIMAKYKTLKQV